MIIWVNGSFGVGKTTTAGLVARRSARLRTFDPESVGFMLRDNLGDVPVADFRDWEPWRVLTPVVADELVRFTGQSLVAPQTVLEETYWDELAGGLAERGHDTFLVLLDADDAIIRSRIESDQELTAARQGRLSHLPRFAAARPWISRRADLIVDTTRLGPHDVADRVWAAVRDRIG